MSGPAKTGSVIYAKNLPAMTDFYSELLGASLVHSNNEFSVLQLNDFQLVIHAMPPQRWHGTGFTAGNAADCEGNVLQLRVFKD